jgi:Fe-Mn family superoxide dismutase
MYEHSYHLDFGSNAAAYVDAFMANIAWPRIAARFAGEAPAVRADVVDAPTAKAMLDADPELIVIDARLAPDAKAVPVRLRGARRAPPEKVDDVAASLPRGKKVLVYCAWGFEIGGDCAARLRERGIDAVGLAGGIGTWRANGLPTEPLNEGDTP